jgi:hypothetical protein
MGGRPRGLKIFLHCCGVWLRWQDISPSDEKRLQVIEEAWKNNGCGKNEAS